MSVREVYNRCLQRAKVLKRLNMFITQTTELSEKQVEESTQRFNQGKPCGRLDGIPIAVKDNYCTKGIQTTCASRMLKGYVPPYTATVVDRLMNEGVILFGKTNMDEFAMGSGSVESIYGPVQNIWGNSLLTDSDTQRATSPRHEGSKVNHRSMHTQVGYEEDSDWFICGGSSGGSAVAVASGVCFAALGSDTGGSVRLPASHCGVVGMKPTYGLCSRHGLIPLANSLDVPGILARTVDDVATILGVISGHDPLDSTTVTDSFQPFDLPDDISVKGLHIGIPKEFHTPDVEADILRAWSRGADYFERAGAKVSQVSLPHIQYSHICYAVLGPVEIASNMARYDGIEYGYRHEGDSTEELFASTRHRGFNDVVRGRILAGNYFLLKDNYERYFLQAMKLRRIVADDFRKVFEGGVDVLLTPSSICPANSYEDFCSIDHRKQTERNDAQLLPVNLAGIPAVTIPATLSSLGMPIGLQLIGQSFKEKQLLTVAKWLEQELAFSRNDLDASIQRLEQIYV